MLPLKLKWNELAYGDEAESEFGNYIVFMTIEGCHYRLAGSQVVHPCGSIEAGRAECEANYDRRRRTFVGARTLARLQTYVRPEVTAPRIIGSLEDRFTDPMRSPK